jgi:hypothetical protein
VLRQFFMFVPSNAIVIIDFASWDHDEDLAHLKLP